MPFPSEETTPPVMKMKCVSERVRHESVFLPSLAAGEAEPVR